MCALCCTEAGHCDGIYIGKGPFKYFHCPYGHKQRKRAVKPARNTYYRGFGTCMLKAFFKPVGLYSQYRLRPFVKVVFIRRHKRRFFKAARKLGFNNFLIKINGSVTAKRFKACVFMPFIRKPFNVYFA